MQTKTQPSLISVEDVRTMLSQAGEGPSATVKGKGTRSVIVTFAMGVAVTALFLLLPGTNDPSINSSKLSPSFVAGNAAAISSKAEATSNEDARKNGEDKSIAMQGATRKGTREEEINNGAAAPASQSDRLLAEKGQGVTTLAGREIAATALSEGVSSYNRNTADITLPSFTVTDLAQNIRREQITAQAMQSGELGTLPLPQQSALGYMVARTDLVPLPEVRMTPRKVTIRPLAGLNTSYNDYNPRVTADGRTLYFISNREHGLGGDDFWVAHKKNREDTHFSEPQNLGSGINTSRDEGAASISADGQTMYFTGCDRADGLGECDIYEARLEEQGWVEVRNLREINSRDWEAQPTISADGRTLYFVSNRPGVMGNHNDADIYVSHKMADGTWSKPENLGKPINTRQREDSPFIAPGGDVLYFSSAGHKGMGGLDFYVAHKNENGEWKEPENLGAAFNTANDERFITLPAAEDVIYFASSNGRGELDLFMAQREASSTSIILNGRIIRAESKESVGAELLFVDGITGQVLAGTKTNDETGEYSLVIGESSGERLIYVYGISDSLGEFRAKIALPSTNSYREYRCDFVVNETGPDMPNINGEWRPGLTVTPGRASDKFAVTAPEGEWGDLTILDAWGHQLMQKFIKSERAEQIDLSMAPNGLYLVRIGGSMAVIPINRPRIAEQN